MHRIACWSAVFLGALVVLAPGASAAPHFSPGNLYTGLQNLNCSSVILGSPYAESEVGFSVSQYVDDDPARLSPVVGEVFDVQLLVATIGNECAGTAPQLEIALPPGVTPAVGGEHTIRCYTSTDYADSTKWQAVPASAGCPTTLDPGMTNHAAVSTWHGLNPNPATYGSPLWKVAQGTAVKVQVPVVADRIMNGIGDTNGCVCVIGSVKTVNGHAMPDSTFTWATATMYGTSYQPLFVFPGELKPTDPRPADPGPAEPLPTTGKPVSSGAPRVTGFARVNSTLRCVRGRWGGAAATFTYAWQSRAGRAGWRTVPRSTKATLRVGRAMRTASLRCRVTARNDSGAATATSRAVRVGTPPVRRSTPRVVGTAKVGSKLTCNRGRWSGTAPLRYDYRWERQTGSRWTRVGTAMRHAVTAADRSRSLRCVVTVSNDSGRAVARSASIGVR